jgi:DNA repair protein RecO (recombination protein O)
MSGGALSPAFVLHRRAYRESSLLVELLTRDAGRVGVVARGARRRRGSTPLEPFVGLLVQWGGRGELGQLRAVERAEPAPRLVGTALYSGFYLNELLVRLLRRHDPHPEIHAGYAATLSALATTSTERIEALLRLFESRLLEACGYGMELRVEVENGTPLDPEARYRYDPERGPIPVGEEASGGLLVHGSALLALASGRLGEARDLRELKPLMRGVLAPHLGARPLASRALFRVSAPASRDVD